MRFTALILIVLAAGAILAFLALKAPEYLPLLFGIAFFFVAAMMLLGIAQAITKGEMPGRGRTTFRRESPVTFWFGIIVFLVAVIFCLVIGFAFLGIFLGLLKEMMHREIIF